MDDFVQGGEDTHKGPWPSIDGFLLEERPDGKVVELEPDGGPPEYHVLLQKMDDVLDGKAKRVAYSTAGEEGFARLEQHFAVLTEAQFGTADRRPEFVTYRDSYFRLAYGAVV